MNSYFEKSQSAPKFSHPSLFHLSPTKPPIEEGEISIPSSADLFNVCFFPFLNHQKEQNLIKNLIKTTKVESCNGIPLTENISNVSSSPEKNSENQKSKNPSENQKALTKKRVHCKDLFLFGKCKNDKTCR